MVFNKDKSPLFFCCCTTVVLSNCITKLIPVSHLPTNFDQLHSSKISNLYLISSLFISSRSHCFFLLLDQQTVLASSLISIFTYYIVRFVTLKQLQICFFGLQHIQWIATTSFLSQHF